MSERAVTTATMNTEELAVTIEQYRPPRPSVRPVSVGSQQENAGAEDAFGGLTVDPHPWKDEGACIGSDPDVFFPERGDPTAPAKAVCRGCRVRETCLEYALDGAEKFGIWGGKSERERRRLRRERNLKAAS